MTAATYADAIEAYCSSLSYLPGETVELCVSTTAARFDLSVVHAGRTSRPVWTAEGLDGVAQPIPPFADAAGCGWATTVEIPVPTNWASGFYLVTLTAHGVPAGYDIAHAGFVVRAGQTRQRVLLIASTNTWNAYNDWGGHSLYTGGHEVSFRRPWARGMLHRHEAERDDRKGWPRRRGELPDVDGRALQAYREAHRYPRHVGSTGWFTHERRFVEWAEGAGFTLDMATSTDLETVPRLTDGYDVVVSAGHDEYWSAEGRDAIESFVAAGGNHLSLSGNTMFWRTRTERDGSSMVCHKYSAHDTDPLATHDPGAMTGLWSDPALGRPERRFFGASSIYGLYARFGRATPLGVPGFVIYRPDHWLLSGTGLLYGDMVGADDAVVGYECMGTRIALDDVNLPVAVLDPALPGDELPPDVEIVALTPATNLGYGDDPQPVAALGERGDLEFIADRVYGGGPVAEAKVRHGNAVILTCRPFGDSGGTVITIGSTDWVLALDDPHVSAVTANALRHEPTR